jgi:DnaJ domain
MLSGSSSILLSLFGWSFIPDFTTRQILNFVYKSPITTIPTPGSIQHRKHYAVTFAFVILTYLTYTVIQSARTMEPNFYQILGVSPNVDENGLKLAFRAFAKRNHPDRPGVGKEGEALFITVRDAFDALKDPAVRFAYDRCVRLGVWPGLNIDEYRLLLDLVQMYLRGEKPVKQPTSSCTEGLWCHLGITL